MEFGKPENSQDLADFILNKLKNREKIDEGITSARDAACDIVINGVDYAMNKYN